MTDSDSDQLIEETPIKKVKHTRTASSLNFVAQRNDESCSLKISHTPKRVMKRKNNNVDNSLQTEISTTNQQIVKLLECNNSKATANSKPNELSYWDYGFLQIVATHLEELNAFNKCEEQDFKDEILLIISQNRKNMMTESRILE